MGRALSAPIVALSVLLVMPPAPGSGVYGLHYDSESHNLDAASILRDPNLTRADRDKARAFFTVQRNAIIHQAVEQLRERLGPAAFRDFDERVRRHILPNLRIQSRPASSPHAIPDSGARRPPGALIDPLPAAGPAADSAVDRPSNQVFRRNP